MANLRKSNGAFTFIEVLVVLIIFGLVFNTAGLLSKNTLSRLREEREVFDSYSQICRLRNESICTLKESRVRFYQDYNMTGKSAYALQVQDGILWEDKGRIILDNVAINSMSFPGGSIQQRFTTMGLPYNTGSVLLKDGEGDLHYLVFYNTGRIRIKNDRK